MTTAAEYLRDRYLKTERSAATQIADAERARDRIRGELHVERVAHIQTRNERDMLARKLAEMSSQRGELKMLVAKAITVCGRHKEHADCRQLASDLAERLEKL
jgi:hypothetical protein